MEWDEDISLSCLPDSEICGQPIEACVCPLIRSGTSSFETINSTLKSESTRSSTITLTLSLLDHAPSTLQTIDEATPRRILLEMPEFPLLLVLEHFRNYGVFRQAKNICSTKCRYCDPNRAKFDLFSESNSMSLPTSEELNIWDTAQKIELANQWGHWPRVYEILPKFHRRQLNM